MSVESDPYIAYGIDIGPDELADYFGAQYRASGCAEEWAEALAKEFGLTMTLAGNAWNGNELFIIGPKIARDNVAATLTVELDAVDATRRLAEKLKPHDSPTWHLGVWVH